MSVSVLRNRGDAANGASPVNVSGNFCGGVEASAVAVQPPRRHSGDASCSRSLTESASVSHHHHHRQSITSRRCSDAEKPMSANVAEPAAATVVSRREMRQRGYSSSESETYRLRHRRATMAAGDAPGLTVQSSRKRPRYDHKSSHRIPYHHHHSSSGSENVHHKNSRFSDSDQLVGTDFTALKQPPAPKNTTQFLITDREERESSDHDTSSTAGPSGEADGGESVSPHHGLMEQDPASQPRSAVRTGCAYYTSHHHAVDEAHSSGSEEEDIEDPEFSAVYDDCSYDRIRNLPREQINREMLVTQKNNLQLTERVSYLISENIRLKKLLEENGVDFNDYGENKTISFCQRSTNCDGTIDFAENDIGDDLRK